MENNHRKFGDTTGKRKQYDSDEESPSSGEEKEEEEEYEVEDDSPNRGVIKKEDCSNEASSKTKNIQKASTPSSKRQHMVYLGRGNFALLQQCTNPLQVAESSPNMESIVVGTFIPLSPDEDKILDSLILSGLGVGINRE